MKRAVIGLCSAHDFFGLYCFRLDLRSIFGEKSLVASIVFLTP